MKTRKGTKVLGYSGTVWDKYGVDRVDIRIIGKVTKKYFVEKVIAEFRNYSRNWIDERVCETKNEVEVNLANEQVGTIFILNENQQILESFSLMENAKLLEKERKEIEIKKLKRLVVKAAKLREKASSWLGKDFYTCQIRDYNEQIETKETK